MERMSEKIGIAAAILIAGLLAYLSFPVLQGLVAPSAPLLWEPVISKDHAAAILTGITGFITGIWLFLAVSNRFRNSRETDDPVIPDWFWVVMLVLIGLIPAALAATLITYIVKAGFDFLHFT